MYLNPQIHGTQDTLTIHVGYIWDTFEDTYLEPYCAARLDAPLGDALGDALGASLAALGALADA